MLLQTSEARVRYGSVRGEEENARCTESRITKEAVASLPHANPALKHQYTLTFKDAARGWPS